MVGGFEPRNSAVGPDMQARLYRGGIVQRGYADIDQKRIIDRLPGQWRAASTAKAADRLGRGVVGDRIASGYGKAPARHGQPRHHRGAMCAPAHFAMAIERLDGRPVDPIAYVAAQAATRCNLIHPFVSVHGAAKLTPPASR